jgi:DUF971 family protein
MSQIEMPSEIRVTEGQSLLAVHWRDGTSVCLNALTLRRNCRCSQCQAERAHAAGRPVTDVRIAAVEPIGTYGINIGFSDGHARGIFPWTYLLDLVAA